jgi:hypothetical protein
VYPEGLYLGSDLTRFAGARDFVDGLAPVHVGQPPAISRPIVQVYGKRISKTDTARTQLGAKE